MTTRWTIEAPAKINLGLEILGKRTDGFHEIRSILSMVTLTDTLTFDFSHDGPTRITFDGSHAVDVQDNLISRAINAFNPAAHTQLGPEVNVIKHIPVAAGLGGASADAAATLIVLNAFTNGALSQSALIEIAATLGSDVPFFLGSPTALVAGRGIELRSLPIPHGHLIIVTPHLAIADKTRRMYGALRAADFSDGSRTHRQASLLERGEALDTAALGNAFTTAQDHVAPLTPNLLEALSLTGVPGPWLSGAGPSRFYLFATPAERDAALQRLTSRLDKTEYVVPAEFHPRPLVARPGVNQ